MNKVEVPKYRKTLVLALAIMLVLALAPVVMAGAEPGVSENEARAEASQLIDRVVSVTEADPGSPGTVPSWRGAEPGEPLLIHSPDGKPSEYIFPVLGKSDEIISVIGVSASTGEWQWYSSSCGLDSFPPVPAGEAVQEAEEFVRKSGVSMDLPLPQARMEADKQIYWFFDLEGVLPVESLHLPVFSEGKIATDLEIVSLEQAEDTVDRGRVTALVDHFGLESNNIEPEDTGGAPAQYDIAGVPYHAQETNTWCGPASLEMVFDYWGPDIPQTEIAGVVDAGASGCYGSDLRRAAQFSSLSTSIQDPGLKGYTNRKLGYMTANAWWSDSPLVADRYSDLKDLVSSNYPVLILTWYDATHSSGHFRVVKGYSNTLDVFIVHDPWYTLPYMGPDVNFNQAFLVDDLWTYSDRWGMVTAPWRANVTKPGSVSSGQKFEVNATVTYPGPSPLAGQFVCSSPYAKIELSNDYELLDVSAAKDVSGITSTGSKGYVSWNVKAKKNKSNTNDITVSTQGNVTGSSLSYSNYEDLIGLGTRFESLAPTWYLAEGSSAWGFYCYIAIENPNNQQVTVDITYMTDSGPVSGGTLVLPAKSHTSVLPENILGEQDFSTKIECREGKQIAVDRTMSWQGPGAPSIDGHCSIGVTSPAKTWYLAEGSSDWGFECWLLIQNPNDTAATCDVTYMIEGAGPATFTKTIPANSRRSYNMADDIGAADASIKVDSNIPVIPERAMYRNNRREGHDSIGTTAPAYEYYLAEGTTAWGFTTYVLIQNPNPTVTTVDVTLMTPSGPVPLTPFEVPANQRRTLRINDFLLDKDFSTQVSGSQPIIAERAMYWGAGTPMGEACHDSIGMAAPHTTFYLPAGETSSTTETWTLVQNPNPIPVTVEISYLTPTGVNNPMFTETIPANSRMTFSMADKIPNGLGSIVVTSKTAGSKIMVERAMYGNSRGAGTDTIGGFSD